MLRAVGLRDVSCEGLVEVAQGVLRARSAGWVLVRDGRPGAAEAVVGARDGRFVRTGWFGRRMERGCVPCVRAAGAAARFSGGKRSGEEPGMRRAV